MRATLLHEMAHLAATIQDSLTIRSSSHRWSDSFGRKHLSRSDALKRLMSERF
jgi:hypothetical protein